MKEKRAAIWKRILAVVLTAALLPVGGVQPVKAAETVSIQVDYRQSEAQTLMGLVNNYRASQTAQAASSGAVTLEPLKYDYGLERVAMKRAAEVALVYRQTRPDGTQGSDLYGYGTYAESLGKETSSTQVYSGWFEQAADRENMLKPDFKAMGVGHVVYNGHDYWVAAYSDKESGEPQQTLAGATTKEITVSSVSQKKVETGLASTLSLSVGETASFANAKASVLIDGHVPAGEYCPLAAGAATGASSDTSVVTVDGTTIRAVKAGTARVTVTCGGQSTDISVTVQQPTMTIEPIPAQNYTGYEVRPTVTVRVGSTVLQAGTHYTADYSNNIQKGTNSALVTVTGMGTYNGYSARAYFSIVTPSLAGATVTQIPDQVYTGNPIYPTFTVYMDGRVLQQGSDYNVTYTNNTNIGTATIVISGINSFAGEQRVTFRITGPNLSAATIDAIPDQVYTGSYLTPALTVKVNDLVLTANVDYTVSYSNNRNVGTATVTITGRGNYTGTRTTTFRILDRDLTYATVESIPNQNYTGSEVRPTVKVTLGGTVLRENVDYTLSYQNNRQPGTASVTITGAGSYKGSKTVTFKIAQMSLAAATVKVANQTYTGKAIKPTVTVKLNGELLVKSQDYTVTYSSNKTPGKATVTITGTGSYSGTVKATFVIKPKKQTLKSAKASGNSAALVWTKDANAKGYEIYRSKKKASGYSRIGSFTTNTTTACRNTNLASGTYYYKIRSYIVVGGKKYYGAFSNIKSVTIR